MEHLPCAVICCYFHDPAPTEIYPLSLHDALPISGAGRQPATVLRDVVGCGGAVRAGPGTPVCGTDRLSRHLSVLDRGRSEEHTSELQSRRDLVCRLLLEKKNDIIAIARNWHSMMR